MIKNALELTPEELLSFSILYKKYFMELLSGMRGQKKGILDEYCIKIKTYRIVRRIMQEIGTGQRTAFVNVDESEDIVTGLLVGDLGGAEAYITHFYVDVKCPTGRRLQAANLFKEFAMKAKGNGSNTISTVSYPQEVELKDSLDSLGFSAVNNQDYSTEHSRKI